VKLPLVLSALTLVALAAGCRTAEAPAQAAPPVLARVFIEALPQEQAVVVTLPVSGARIEVDPRPVLLEFDLERVELVSAEFGRALLLQFNAAAARDLFRQTTGTQGRRFVLSLNGAPAGVFTIAAPVTSGLLTFYPEIPDERLPQLVRGLQQTTAGIRGRLARQN
jgi:hypothetical protein